MAISRSAFSCNSALRRLSCSSLTLSAAAQAICDDSSLSFGWCRASDDEDALPFRPDEGVVGSLPLMGLEAKEDEEGLLMLMWCLPGGGEENLKSSPQPIEDDDDLLLLSTAAATVNGSGRPFQAESEKALSKSMSLLFDFNGVVVVVMEANGSLSNEKGSKLSELLSFFFKPLVGVAGTATGSSLLFVANGSPKPTSLNGSSVNSNSA